MSRNTQGRLLYRPNTDIRDCSLILTNPYAASNIGSDILYSRGNILAIYSDVTYHE